MTTGQTWTMRAAHPALLVQPGEEVGVGVEGASGVVSSRMSALLAVGEGLLALRLPG